MGVIIKDGIIYSGGSSGSGQQADFTETDTTSPAYIKHKPTLGTASAKDSTTTIASGNTDLPTSEAVYDALQNVHVDVDTEIDSTSNNPIANSAVADALDDKVDVESGKGLSTNDFTTAYKNKLDGIESGAKANVQTDWSESSSSSDAYILNKPTSLSAFTNDQGFITNTVNNLTNYYTKNESYTKTEVDTMISAVKSGRFIYVATLPTTDIHTDAIYLVPKTISQEDNIKDEYINLDGTTEGWEKIGDTEIDLSNYIQVSDTVGLLKNDGTVDTNHYVVPDVDFAPKTWKGLTNFSGMFIWTDGNNVYFSNASTQYILNKSTDTWETKTWSGLTDFYGSNVWTDGNNIYYSQGSNHYVLDTSNDTWSTKTWSGTTSFAGANVWTDGTSIYLSSGTSQYILNKSIDTWETKTWSGLTSFNGTGIWKNGNNIYYSNGTNQYVLNKSADTWSAKTWSGLTDFDGEYIWTDGNDIYYSRYSSTSGNSQQYILNKSTDTWISKTWKTYNNITGVCIWTDGNSIYYSVGGNNYVYRNDLSDYAKKADITTISKTRYTITATNWSNSVDANGYYTYTITLNPELSLSWPPSTDIAGVNDSTFSTDAEKEAYDLLDECNLITTSTLILYAKTKPETTFYIWVEGEVAS